MGGLSCGYNLRYPERLALRLSDPGGQPTWLICCLTTEKAWIKSLKASWAESLKWRRVSLLGGCPAAGGQPWLDLTQRTYQIKCQTKTGGSGHESWQGTLTEAVPKRRSRWRRLRKLNMIKAGMWFSFVVAVLILEHCYLSSLKPRQLVQFHIDP